jgi:hypothetical protein
MPEIQPSTFAGIEQLRSRALATDHPDHWREYTRKLNFYRQVTLKRLDEVEENDRISRKFLRRR